MYLWKKINNIGVSIEFREQRYGWNEKWIQGYQGPFLLKDLKPKLQ